MNAHPSITAKSRAAVVGFGRAGRAAARYLRRCGAEVLVSETRCLEELSAAERELLRELSAEFEGGGHSAQFLERAELILVSPGVDYRHPSLAAARAAGIEIVGELALGASIFAPPVIGITGTNGKTTVTELVGALLRRAGRTPFVGGNIGTPIGEYLCAPSGYDAIVLELSSFQLELCGAFAPQVAVLLNISPDHLDRHRSLDDYVDAKVNIFRGGAATTTAIVNDDDELSRRSIARSGRDRFQRFGTSKSCDAVIAGTGITLNPSGRNYELSGGSLATRSGLLNSAAALLAVEPFGLDDAIVRRTLLEFRTGPHRMQTVFHRGGVRYINDSKATNSGAVVNALRQTDGPVILIAGGKDKGDDYRLLRGAAAERVKRFVLIGETAGRLAAALGDLAPVSHAANLGEAVRLAAAAAEPGDTVLLSPACASFDMFSSYIDRGEQFVRAVQLEVGAEPTEAAV